MLTFAKFWIRSALYVMFALIAIMLAIAIGTAAYAETSLQVKKLSGDFSSWGTAFWGSVSPLRS